MHKCEIQTDYMMHDRLHDSFQKTKCYAMLMALFSWIFYNVLNFNACSCLSVKLTVCFLESIGITTLIWRPNGSLYSKELKVGSMGGQGVWFGQYLVCCLVQVH